MAAAARCWAPGARAARAAGGALARLPLPRPSPGIGVGGLEGPERPAPPTIESAVGGTERPRRGGRGHGLSWPRDALRDGAGARRGRGGLVRQVPLVRADAAASAPPANPLCCKPEFAPFSPPNKTPPGEQPPPPPPPPPFSLFVSSTLRPPRRLPGTGPPPDTRRSRHGATASPAAAGLRPRVSPRGSAAWQAPGGGRGSPPGAAALGPARRGRRRGGACAGRGGERRERGRERRVSQAPGGMEPGPPPTERPQPPPQQPREEEEEEEEDWLRPQPGGAAASPAPYKAASARSAGRRVIVHLDLDCFYAQVEMIRNPELRDKPLGVQQKNIVVTCNYEARKCGVKKMMSVRDAKEKVPQLILVNGEDLTPYREMSYKVTEIVEKRLNQLQQSGCSRVCVSGHVYNNQAINLQDTTHVRLVIGSQIAEELREAIYVRLGLTGCAGVASNKLLSKLVSGTFKPNQQTVLLPESCQDLIRGLEHIQKVPGIGYKTTKRLETLGVRNVCDLQAFPSAVLEKELGVSNAQRIQKLSYGEDDSPVTPSGPPQSFSDEDSFKKCSSEEEVKEKIEELLHNLLDRIDKDGRQPHTVRLTIRQFSSTDKWLNRESRQCPVPPHLIQKFGKESSNIISPLVDILMKLFRKMIDVDLPFHLTLLSVCFSNLKDLPSSKKGSIGFYLKQMSPPSVSSKRVREVEDVSQGEGSASWNQSCNRTGTTKTRKLSEEKKSNIKKEGIPDFPFHLFPAGIDQEVFRELPEDIKKEILSGKTEAIPTENVSGQPSVCFAEEAYSTSPDSKGLSSDTRSAGCSTTSAHESATALAYGSRASCSSDCPRSALTSSSMENQPPGSRNFRGRDLSPLEAGASQTVLRVPTLDKDKQAFETASEDKAYSGKAGVVFPPNVDTKTFYELPADVQEELLAEWKNREPVPKTSRDKPPEKPKANKGRKNTAPCLSQSNSLLRYFKPQ
ncbi:DNA polymerase iota isoform 1-T1 [Alca torda]